MKVTLEDLPQNTLLPIKQAADLMELDQVLLLNLMAKQRQVWLNNTGKGYSVLLDYSDPDNDPRYDATISGLANGGSIPAPNHPRINNGGTELSLENVAFKVSDLLRLCQYEQDTKTIQTSLEQHLSTQQTPTEPPKEQAATDAREGPQNQPTIEKVPREDQIGGAPKQPLTEAVEHMLMELDQNSLRCIKTVELLQRMRRRIDPEKENFSDYLSERIEMVKKRGDHWIITTKYRLVKNKKYSKLESYDEKAISKRISTYRRKSHISIK